ncbi:hypothetical protein KDL01_00790 [Actinospica durhamensis]|uniref:Polymerase nucleotidyl transferase domain-containing protein n=1 Tax=Actinospica durhamensis TaxID=1508375 RepID=A0A941EJ54_9ACTN|nr:hypothetical protein [Actinospica durhamensis]MBR7831773.1 hypothetical protein [Actinospica durhamensis]
MNGARYGGLAVLRSRPTFPSATESAHLRRLVRDTEGLRSLLLDGPLARGWRHVHSDVDIVMIGPSAPRLEEPLEPTGEANAFAFYQEGKRWCVRLRTEEQVDRLIEQIRDLAAVTSTAGPPAHPPLAQEAWDDVISLYDGESPAWAAGDRDWREALREAGLPRVAAQRAARRAGGLIGQACTQLGNGDHRSAVLAMSQAAEASIDAWLAHNGRLSPGEWRMKHCAMLEHESAPGRAPFEVRICWRWLTHADLPPLGPEDWVRDCISFCQGLLADCAI